MCRMNISKEIYDIIDIWADVKHYGYDFYGAYSDDEDIKNEEEEMIVNIKERVVVVEVWGWLINLSCAEDVKSILIDIIIVYSLEWLRSDNIVALHQIQQ